MQLITKTCASTGSCFHTVLQTLIKTCSTAHAHSPAAGHPTEQLIHALGSGRQGRNQRGNHDSIWGLAAREGIRHALGSGCQGGKHCWLVPHSRCARHAYDAAHFAHFPSHQAWVKRGAASLTALDDSVSMILLAAAPKFGKHIPVRGQNCPPLSEMMTRVPRPHAVGASTHPTFIYLPASFNDGCSEV